MPTPPDRSLWRYGLTISGPRDFVINLTINTVIPWWILRGYADAPFFGDPSVMSLWAPMGFLLVSITTFFGYFNGVNQRQSGRWGAPLKRGWHWLMVALPSALFRGLIGLVLFVVVILALGLTFPAARFPAWGMIVTQGLFAAVLAFWVQVAGVQMAARLPDLHP